MQQVLQRIGKRLETSRQPVYIAYAQATLEDPEDKTSNLEMIAGMNSSQPVPVKYNSLYDRILLGSFTLTLHKLS